MCNLFLNSPAKLGAWNEVPASGPEGVLQSGCICDLRGTPRAHVQMFPYHRRILRRQFPIQISIEHFES
jgi:hypothetical protein